MLRPTPPTGRGQQPLSGGNNNGWCWAKWLATDPRRADHGFPTVESTSAPKRIFQSIDESRTAASAILLISG